MLEGPIRCRGPQATLRDLAELCESLDAPSVEPYRARRGLVKDILRQSQNWGFEPPRDERAERDVVRGMLRILGEWLARKHPEVPWSATKGCGHDNAAQFLSYPEDGVEYTFPCPKCGVTKHVRRVPAKQVS